jgi:NADPH:quinone reductase-like Zn-dependent oxidoreductase
VACADGRQNECAQFTVLGNAVDGGDCELLAVSPISILPIPNHLRFNDAASVPLVFTTAWHMLVTLAKVRPGQTVLILGAGSGVGTAAIQISKLLNARVIATAGDENKMAKGLDLGADFVVNHYKQKISEEVRKLTGKVGADVVFEHVGAATWDESMRSLRPGGTLVTCGATTGPEAKIDLRFLFARQLSLLGSYMGTLGDFHEVMGHVFAGRLKAVVDRVFPLADVRAAHEYLATGQMFGKVVLNP